MNWKVFLGLFALPFCGVYRIDCLKVADIVNGLNVGAKYPTFTIPKGKRLTFWGAFLKWAISWK